MVKVFTIVNLTTTIRTTTSGTITGTMTKYVATFYVFHTKDLQLTPSSNHVQNKKKKKKNRSNKDKCE